METEDVQAGTKGDLLKQISEVLLCLSVNNLTISEGQNLSTVFLSSISWSAIYS